jgi:hypothetical protein
VTEPEIVPCEHCDRPLKTAESRALGYGPVCAAGVLGFDTHRTPIPRPRRRPDPGQLSLDSLTVPEGPTDVITIHGASDDLIEVDGAINAEFPVTNTGDDGVLLAISNGVVLRIQYRDVLAHRPRHRQRDLVQIVQRAPRTTTTTTPTSPPSPVTSTWVICRDDVRHGH